MRPQLAFQKRADTFLDGKRKNNTISRISSPCQVRVSRFYQSCFLLLWQHRISASDLSPPGLSGCQNMGQKVCQNRCPIIECQIEIECQTTCQKKKHNWYNVGTWLVGPPLTIFRPSIIANLVFSLPPLFLLFPFTFEPWTFQYLSFLFPLTCVSAVSGA